MSIDYTADQLEYRDRMREARQGVIIYNQPGATTGTEWNPVQGSPTPYTLDAAAKGVSQQYVDGTSVFATDIEVTAAVRNDIVPTASGTMTIDGQALAIVRFWKVPAAGTPVAWRFICRG